MCSKWIKETLFLSSSKTKMKTVQKTAFCWVLLYIVPVFPTSSFSFSNCFYDILIWNFKQNDLIQYLGFATKYSCGGYGGVVGGYKWNNIWYLLVIVEPGSMDTQRFVTILLLLNMFEMFHKKTLKQSLITFTFVWKLRTLSPSLK